MEAYRALFKEHRKSRVYQLTEGVIFRLESRDGGVVAHVNVLPENGVAIGPFKFWVSRKDKPCGARRRVLAGRGQEIPIITYDKFDFVCEIGTTVLFVRPKNGCSAFPVIAIDDYLKAVRVLEREQPKEPERPLKKGQHRFV